MKYDEIKNLKIFKASTKLLYGKYAYKIRIRFASWHHYNRDYISLYDKVKSVESTCSTHFEFRIINTEFLSLYVSDKDAFESIVTYCIRNAKRYSLTELVGPTTTSHLEKLENGGETNKVYRTSLFYGKYKYSIRFRAKNGEWDPLIDSVLDFTKDMNRKITTQTAGPTKYAALFLNSYEDMITLKMMHREYVSSNVEVELV